MYDSTRDSIMAEELKCTEQSVLKNQHLNKRAQIEGQSKGEQQPEVGGLTMPQGFKYVYIDYGKDPTCITEQLMTTNGKH